jgi:hypothetical protein
MSAEKSDIDLIAREAFARMIGEVVEIAEVETVASGVDALARGTIARSKRKTRFPAALALTAAAFCALAVIPPIAVRGKPGFAERAARLPDNPQLKRYGELLAISRLK